MTLPQALRHEAMINGNLIRLRPLQHELLTLLLLRSPGHLVPAGDIVEALWPDPDRQPLATTDTIHFCVMQLRRIGVPVEVRRGLGWRIPEEARGVPMRRAA